MYRPTALALLAFLLPFGAAEAATKTTLLHFGAAVRTGPSGALGFDSSGALYGAIARGGSKSAGLVFRLAPPGPGETRWTWKILHTFRGGSDGKWPSGGVTVAPDGSVYGTTMTDGLSNGTVYELKPPLPDMTAWRYQIIHTFGKTKDGAVPLATVTVADGKLYGTTESNVGFGNLGAVYELAPPTLGSTAWTEKLIQTFGDYDTALPATALTRDSSGGLVGTTMVNSRLFRLRRPAAGGAVWAIEYLPRAPGYVPSQLILGKSGVLYGSVPYDGNGGQGTVYALVPPITPDGVWSIQTIWAFGDGTDGFYPGNLVLAPDGRLFGISSNGNLPRSNVTESGVIFQLAPPVNAGDPWTKTVLYRFKGGVDGIYPSGLVLGPDGALYGTTSAGGAFGMGTVFKVVP